MRIECHEEGVIEAGLKAGEEEITETDMKMHQALERARNAM